MLLRITAVFLFFLLFVARAHACMCMTQDLIQFGKTHGNDVFEGSVVCYYGDQDLANLIRQEFVVFKVNRYWGENSVPEYVVLSNIYGSSCYAFFKGKKNKYIITTKRNYYGQYPVNQCDVMPVERLTKTMIARHGQGRLVAPGSGYESYLKICSKNEDLQTTLAKKTYRLAQLERERTWHLLFLQSLLVYPVLLLFGWLGGKIKFYPVSIILKSIAVASVIGLFLRSLLGLVLEKHLAGFSLSDRLKPEALGIYNILWHDLKLAVILAVLTLPALLSRFNFIKSRRWLTLLTFLLLPAVFQVMLMLVNLPGTDIYNLYSNDILDTGGIFTGLFYLSFLVYYLTRKPKS